MGKYSVWILVPVKDVQLISTSESLEACVADLRNCWQEDRHEDGSFDAAVFGIFDDDGYLEATLIRGDSPQSCITVYANGQVDRHECKYVTGADGTYDHTEVTEAATRGWDHL